MKEGFPLLTTKKMYWKGIVAEMLWFLRGDTNIRFLLQNNCHIWTGDAYKKYEKWFDDLQKRVENPQTSGDEDVSKYVDSRQMKKLTVEEFEHDILTNDDFCKMFGDLGPIYGAQWRKWEIQRTTRVNNEPSKIFPGNKEVSFDYIDQITNLINDLKTNPDSRRLMVSAWNVSELDQMTLPPCHYGFQVYTRELSLDERVTIFNQKKEKGESVVPEFNSVGDMNAWTSKLLDNDIPTRAISLMWNQRSVDTFLGLPFNIASYGLLLEIIAKEVNMVPDQLIGNLGDVHIYNNHFDQVREQIIREPYPLPKLKIEKEVKWAEGDCLPTYSLTDFELEGYQSHPTIKAPLSN
jgi:thymidylate synthase